MKYQDGSDFPRQFERESSYLRSWHRVDKTVFRPSMTDVMPDLELDFKRTVLSTVPLSETSEEGFNRHVGRASGDWRCAGAY